MPFLCRLHDDATVPQCIRAQVAALIVLHGKILHFIDGTLRNETPKSTSGRRLTALI